METDLLQHLSSLTLIHKRKRGMQVGNNQGEKSDFHLFSIHFQFH